jgi:hypothetical protein
MVCIRIVWWIFWRGVVFGALLGAAFGTLLFPIIGTLYGLFYGALIGVIMGAVNAFALGAVAHFFMDMEHPWRIVPWLRCIGVTITGIGVYIYMHLLQFTDPIAFLPPLLAMTAVYLLCPRFVKFAVYIQEPDRILVTNIVW